MIIKFNEYLHYVEAPAIRGVNKNIVLNLVEDKETSDIFYKEANDDDVIFLTKYLRKNKFNLIELFHGTSEENDIENMGLLKTKNKTKKSIQSMPGFVYVSIFKKMAEEFGKMAYPHSKISVYKVTVPVYFLKPDLDQLRNQRLFAGRNVNDTLGDSAIFGHGFRIKGDIPPYMIKKIK